MHVFRYCGVANVYTQTHCNVLLKMMVRNLQMLLSAYHDETTWSDEENGVRREHEGDGYGSHDGSLHLERTIAVLEGTQASSSHRAVLAEGAVTGRADSSDMNKNSLKVEDAILEPWTSILDGNTQSLLQHLWILSLHLLPKNTVLLSHNFNCVVKTTDYDSC